MPRKWEYKCTRCGRGEADGVTRDTLAAKKVMFVTMGEGSRTIRSRVTDWLCPKCIVQDVDWNRPAGIRPHVEDADERSNVA